MHVLYKYDVQNEFPVLYYNKQIERVKFYGSNTSNYKYKHDFIVVITTYIIMIRCYNIIL